MNVKILTLVIVLLVCLLCSASAGKCYTGSQAVACGLCILLVFSVYVLVLGSARQL